MSTQRSIALSLAGAIALALYGVASVAAAQPAAQQAAQQQVPPPPPAAPAPPPPPAAPQPPPPPAAPQNAPQPPPAAPQPPPPPAAPQNAPQQTASGQFYQGTETSASYPLPDSNGGTLTVRSGMPANVQNYGPPPPFKSLDTNHDGRITEAEAQAYPPLDSDFLFASNQGKTISRAQYEQWVNAQH